MEVNVHGLPCGPWVARDTPKQVSGGGRFLNLLYKDVDLLVVRAVKAVWREPNALFAITFDNLGQVRVFAGAKLDAACRLSIFEHCRHGG